MSRLPPLLAASPALVLLAIGARAQDSEPPAVPIPVEGFLDDGQREAKRKELLAPSSVLQLRGQPSTPVRALQHVVELALETPSARWKYFVVQTGETAATGFELAFPNIADAARTEVRVELAVLEPGMAVLAAAHGGERRIDWLPPQAFLLPMPVERFLRGTRRAQRTSELALANGANLPSIPEVPQYTAEANGTGLEWIWQYPQRSFRSPFAKGSIEFERSERSPLRILCYIIATRAAGQAEPVEHARCLDLESLELALRRLGGEAANAAAPRPRLSIGLASEPVLAWSIAKPQRDGKTAEPRRAVLITKPSFAPYWLASPTFNELAEFEGAKVFAKEQRQVPLYYDAMGWSVQLEDLAEVARALEAASVDPAAAPLAPLFERATLELAWSAQYGPNRIFDAARYQFDPEPVRGLRKPPAK